MAEALKRIAMPPVNHWTNGESSAHSLNAALLGETGNIGQDRLYIVWLEEKLRRLVLQNDNFASIVAAIEEGRSIYENIRKFIRFFFSTDLALIALMTAGLGMAFLLGLKDPTGGTFLPAAKSSA
jgi:hypothetical protein